jgi:hypothetical protein
MRQLGARLPELPPVKTDVETPSEIQPHERHPAEAPEPYPVEVHRIERRPVRSAPAGVPPSAIPEPAGVPQTVPEFIADPPAVTEEPLEPIAEPIAVMQATPEATAQPLAETQISPELSTEPAAVAQAPPENSSARVIETEGSPSSPELVAVPQAVSEPIAAPPVVTQEPPKLNVGPPAAPPVTPRRVLEPQAPPNPDTLRITEAPRSTPELPLRRSAEPSLAHRSGVRSEGRPGLRHEVRSDDQELPESNLGGRWAEFQDFRRIEPGRGSRISLEPMQAHPLPPRGLLAADREPEHRSSFLTIAVPGIAAILAVGALLWSGSLRDRVLRQDAEMTALQQQNRKLADTLAQMNVDQKVVGALNASGSAPTNAPDQTAQNPTNSLAEPAQPQTANPSGNENAQASSANGSTPAPAPTQAPQSAGKREGVSVPPPIQSARRRGSHRPVDTGYHPEIVPPYPTLPQTQNAAQAKSTSTAPAQQAYRAPVPANSPTSPAPSAAPTHTTQPSATPTRTTQSAAVSPSPPSGANPTTGYGIGSSPAYNATGNGVYASALAQNIEAVDSLQRQSQVPLREFHARDGVSVKVTPGLFITLRSPDKAHATYALLVSGSSGSYQLRGHVNSPLGFADNTTHRGYELVILRIAGQEGYGYVRPVQ